MRIRIGMILALAATLLVATSAGAAIKKTFAVSSNYYQDNYGSITSLPHGYWSGPQTWIIVTDNENGTSTLHSLSMHNTLTNTYDSSGSTGTPGTLVYIESDYKVVSGANLPGTGSFGAGMDFDPITGWHTEGKGIYCESVVQANPLLYPPLGPTSCPGGFGLIEGAWGPGPGVPAASQSLGDFVYTNGDTTVTTSLCPNAHPNDADCLYGYSGGGGLAWGRHQSITGDEAAAAPSMTPIVAIGGLGGAMALFGFGAIRRNRKA